MCFVVGLNGCVYYVMGLFNFYATEIVIMWSKLLCDLIIRAISPLIDDMARFVLVVSCSLLYKWNIWEKGSRLT